MPPAAPLTEDAIVEALQSLESPWSPQVRLEYLLWPSDGGGPDADLLVRVRWGDLTSEFAAECRSRSTPKMVDDAMIRARRASDATGLAPMVIVPFLDERRLDRLAEAGISGIDLNGNGIIIVPDRILLRRAGCPNQYPESQPTKYAYRGATSIVPRMFLSQPSFETVSAIRDAIAKRGGRVVLSTVSKALARMTADLFVARDDSTITLEQPDALLDALRDSFVPPVARATVRVKIDGSLATLFQRANPERTRPVLVLSGASSSARYAAGMRSDEPVAYCTSLRDLRDRAGDRWTETERFADLTIIETRDRTPFFDSRIDADGVAYAAPLQAWLELAGGDKREKEMAAEIRESILHEVEALR